MTEPAKPGILDRFRARYPWFDHVMRAQERYQDSKGDFYAAGITYFTVFAIFPLLMVAFAIGGFVLARQPELLASIEERIKSTVSGNVGEQLVDLMDAAIKSRTSVGVIGLATAAWAGLGWMANLREALSQMWGFHRDEPRGFVRNKLSDLAALVGTFIAIVVTISLTALGNSELMKDVLKLLGLQNVPGVDLALRVVSLVMSLLIAWLLFTWIIARLPRESVSIRSSVRAGLLAAVGFEVFKQVATDLPAIGADRSGGRGVRSGAGPDGVRVHHRAADPVRDGVGGDVDRKPCPRTGRGARPGADHSARAVPRGFRRARGPRCGCGGGPWRARHFAASSTLTRARHGEHHAATVGRRVQFGDRTVRSQRLGEAADQCVVHLTDELRLRLRQSMKRTVGHEDSAVLGARLVAVACEDFYGEVQCRADGTRQVVTDCRVAEVLARRCAPGDVAPR